MYISEWLPMKLMPSTSVQIIKTSIKSQINELKGNWKIATLYKNMEDIIKLPALWNTINTSLSDYNIFSIHVTLIQLCNFKIILDTKKARTIFWVIENINGYEYFSPHLPLSLHFFISVWIVISLLKRILIEVFTFIWWA